MASFSVSLPIRRDSRDGFVMNKKFTTLVKQNLKMLLLTNPGERIMEPEFGVGLKSFLFQNFHDSTIAEIDSKIKSQVAKYMPILVIINISYDQSFIDQNGLGISIQYSVPNIGATDLLQITI